jgi:hypothetical protein
LNIFTDMKKRLSLKHQSNDRSRQTRDRKKMPPSPEVNSMVKAVADLVEVAQRQNAKAAAGRPPYQPPADKARLLAVFTLLSPVGGVTIQNLPALFSEDRCPECLLPRGQRTKRIMEVTCDSAISRRCDGVLAQPDVWPAGPTFHLYSQEFLSLLTVKERRLFRWRRVQVLNPTKITKEMFELVHSTYHFPTVVLRGSNPDRETCDTCGWSSLPSYSPVGTLPEWLNLIGDAVRRGQPDHYLSVADLPEPVPPCFTIGDWRGGVQLVFTDDRWREIKKQRGTTGIGTLGIGVVDPALVESMTTV